DVYISVLEALKHAAAHNGVKLKIDYIDTKDNAPLETLSQYDGILVPGGFGEAGIGGKIGVIEYARKNKIPYFGLCYGMQLMVVEYARNVAKLKGAHTNEVDQDAPHPVIAVMESQKDTLAEGKY